MASMLDRDRSATDRRSLDYLRKRSLHRLWWKSASVALKRNSPRVGPSPTSNRGGWGSVPSSSNGAQSVPDARSSGPLALDRLR